MNPEQQAALQDAYAAKMKVAAADNMPEKKPEPMAAVAPTTAAAAAQVDLMAGFRQNLAAEHRRASAINAAAGGFHDIAATAIEQGWSVEKTELRAGRPVAVGWLHRGGINAPSGGGHWSVVIGVDPARSGADSTVIVVRQGRDLLHIKRYRGDDTMTVVGHVIDAIEEYKPTLTVLDEGGLGYGILDRLTEQRYKVRGVNFGWKSKNPVMWGNKRAELWGAMREWLKSAHIPADRQLKIDLTGPKVKPDSSGTVFLESKKDMKARGLASPDAADALACTFAFPVASRQSSEARTSAITRSYSSPDAVRSGWMGY